MDVQRGHAFLLDKRSTPADVGQENYVRTEQGDYTPNRGIVQTSRFPHGTLALCPRRGGMVHAKRTAGKAAHGESGGRDMSKIQPEYLSYLLRLWRENDSVEVHGVETPLWRASLERPQVGERQGFANLTDLFAFLEEQTKSSLLSPEPRRRMDKPHEENQEV
jgi:hypothetical protein